MAEDISVPQGATYATDAMCLLHGISRPAPTYEALALQVLHLMLIGTDHADCMSIIHWVVDTYPPFSIKATVHGMREEHTGNALEHTIKSGSQHVPPQFKQALCNGSYKEELKFFPGKLEEPDLGLHWTANTVHYIWFWMSLNHIPSTQVCPVCCPAWPLSIKVTVHEEADTRILLHVKHALCPPLTLMSLPWLCMLFMLFTYRVEEDKAWHQCYIYTKLSGFSSMSWPPKYAFILWMWLY